MSNRKQGTSGRRSTLAKRSLVAGLALALIAVGTVHANDHQQGLPLPELNFAAPVLPPRPCEYDVDDRHEKRLYKLEGWKGPNFERYAGACERLSFAYGPIVVKPGQNDVLIEPVTIQSPRRNGYVTRFKPNLVLHDGTVPPVEDVHLHHGTWLSVPETYGGSLPFLASGEEKTIGPWPRGYGMPVKATDQWLLLYMVHSAITRPMVAFITYEMDFVPEAKAAEHGIKPAYPFWLDVRPSGYPVFNVQRKYGGGNDQCTWPKQQCADFDPWGNKFVGQGMPGNGKGNDSFRFPELGGSIGQVRSFTGGTVVGLGGHLHPGGKTVNVDLVRKERAKRIFTSEGVYWDHDDPRKPGGPPTSWDLSMTVTGLPFWGIRVKPGDALRINATYGTERWATYENMGIAVGAFAPHTPDGEPTAPGLNPFKAKRDRSRECRVVKRRLRLPVSKAVGRGLQARPRELCDRGVVTHGHYETSGNHSGPGGRWDARPGRRARDVTIANFQYRPGDLSTRTTDGVPRVKLGDRLRFTNLDGAGTGIYHSITTCRFPCLGPTGSAFPIGDGRTSAGRDVDLDSGQLGIGLPAITPAKQTLNWSVPVTREKGFEPGETVTYYCRIHPFMRGAFEVEE